MHKTPPLNNTKIRNIFYSINSSPICINHNMKFHQVFHVTDLYLTNSF
nr:MAG TPA: hypothetical protein [Caudoviricetes sp.]